MIKLLLSAALATSALVAADPAAATVLLPGSTGVAFSPFDVTTQGTSLATLNTTNVAATYTEQLRSAVYRNTLGTLDFYFQVSVNSILSGDEIFNLTASNFTGFTVDALVSAADLDGAGFFTASNNPNLDPNEPSGSTTTASRSGSGQIVRADFGANGLEGAGQTSATYIFRTNATNYDAGGTFTTQDGSTVTRANFEPTSAVPEPATWALMLIGFGAVGFSMRRGQRANARLSAVA